MSKSVEPSIAETAFSCPHCGAFTTQFWYKLFAEALGDDSKKTPFIPKRADKEKMERHPGDNGRTVGVGRQDDVRTRFLRSA